MTLLSLQTYGSPGHKPHLFLKPNILGVHCSSEGFKSWRASCGAQTPHPSGRNATFLRSLLTMGQQAGCVVFGTTMSLPPPSVSIWPFYPSLWSSYSASSQVLFRANCYICRCIFSVSMGGGEFRIILCHHLQLLPPTGCLFWNSY